MKTNALVVEDDPRIAEEIEDVLESIGHEHTWVDNLQDARNLLGAEDFAYVLLDLEIPSRPKRGLARKENGSILLEEIQQLKGHRRLPVIVMTGHLAYCVNHGADYLKEGAYAMITKPFPTESRTLPSVIKKVLRDQRREAREQKNGGNTSAPSVFAGGELVFFDDRIELLGVKIISDKGGGVTMSILGELRHCNASGRYIPLSAEELSIAVGASDGINTITGCIRNVRNNIVRRLRKHLNMEATKESAIGRDEQGYFLQDCIEVMDGEAEAEPVDAPMNPSKKSDAVDILNERQSWVLRELRRGVRLRRSMLEHKFDVGDKTAKRDLADLARRGEIEFVREGREGYYRLK